MPRSSSRASRKTWLSSTRTIRIGRPMPDRMLLRRQKQRVVRLSAALDVDLDVRMRRRDARQDAVERRFVLAEEQRQQAARLHQETLDDSVRDVLEAVAARDRR